MKIIKKAKKSTPVKPAKQTATTLKQELAPISSQNAKYSIKSIAKK